MKLIAGTRSSALALRQTSIIVELIQAVRPELEIRIAEYATSGDRAIDVPIDELDAFAFTDALDEALLFSEIDFAVHSYKDLPPLQPSGLMIGAVPLRADSREALVSRTGVDLRHLPSDAVVGVSSERRGEAVPRIRPDLVLRPIRGAVDVRVEKVLRG